MAGKKTTTADGKEPTGKEIRLANKTTMRAYNEAVTDKIDAVDEAAERLKDAKDVAKKGHLEPRPFELAKKLHDDVRTAKNESIAAEKLARFLAHFDEARKFFKLDELANLQGRMFAAGPIGESSDDGEGDEPPRETQPDGEPDDRPRHLRQPGASAASAVQDLAAKSGANLPKDGPGPIDQVGRGKPH